MDNFEFRWASSEKKSDDFFPLDARTYMAVGDSTPNPPGYEGGKRSKWQTQKKNHDY